MLTMTIPEEASKVEEPVEIPGTPLSFDNTDTAFFNELSKGFEDLAEKIAPLHLRITQAVIVAAVAVEVLQSGMWRTKLN